MKFGYKKVVSFRATDEQVAELQAEADKAMKAGDKGVIITVGEIARRRTFPDGSTAVRLIEHRPGFIDSDAPLATAEGTTEQVLTAPWLQRFAKATGFIRWSVADGGGILMAEFKDGRDWGAATVARGVLRGLPEWRGPRVTP